MDPEILVLALICGLLVVPRALQRFRIPAPLTCVALGIGASIAASEFREDVTLTLLATLGISSLFLFAGIEIDLKGLWKGKGMLAGHLAIRVASVTTVAWAGVEYLGLGWPEATLLAIALLTPSTGFILESLSRLGLTEEERFWVSNKAISAELVALAVLFGVLQSTSLERLGTASAALAALIVLLPFAYLLLGRLVVPHAPGSEFSLLVMVGLVAAYVTKLLGAYYLVGAFLAGLTARLLRRRMPALSSAANEHAVKVFASFFIPFYFFASGMHVPAEALTWDALGIGLAISAIILPLRVGTVWLHRRLFLRESPESSRRVAVALMPTLIFTLVLAAILRERYGIDDALFGGLLVYAAVSTALPSLLLAGPVDFGMLFDEEEQSPPASPALPPAAMESVPEAGAGGPESERAS
ncbi:MAG: cation:proton antiporter [Betaproteobacteria bacterium]|nr:cation:proton antiporter [Betaproteobacteria bacterium]